MNGGLTAPPAVLRLAGHPIRWSLLTRLARSDYRVQGLGVWLQLPQNLISYHLGQLRASKLVTERKSSADECSVYSSLDLEHFRALCFQAGEHLYPAVADAGVGPGVEIQPGKTPEAPLRVLFLCTHNSARSQMAEALLRQLSQGRIEAESAGSEPAERIHPLAVRAMQYLDIEMGQAHPKHFNEFRDQHFDAIVTVCDRVREVCPVFPNDPERIHWSFPDPTDAEGSEDEQYRVFEQTSMQLVTRIRLLITLLEREHRQPC